MTPQDSDIRTTRQSGSVNHTGTPQGVEHNGHDKERGDFAEFALMQRDRRAFDPAEWRRVVDARLRMPAPDLSSLDPGPTLLMESQVRVVFRADRGHEASVREVKTHHEGALGLVSTVEVDAKHRFVPGTLAVRIDRDDLHDVDPRTLHLLRWNDHAQRYHHVPASGVNLRDGYVWGRITRPGVYTVYGLPMPHAFDHVVESTEIGGFLVIVSRLFSPTSGWENLGPRHLSCAILDLAIDPTDHERIYCAASDGGVWRLDSVRFYPERTWVPLTDRQPSLKVTCLAVSPADSRVVYYVENGGRLYRSNDRGSTWSLTSGTSLGSAWRLLAHPTDANTIYVASTSGFWGSTSGGATWQSNVGQTTLRDGDMTDAALDPANPLIIYLAEMNTGVLKSYDSGSTWQTVLPWSAATAPSGNMIKLAVGGQGTDATRTVVAKLDQEVFVNRRGGRPPSDPNGGAWTSLGQQGGDGYGSWCHVVAVDPFDDNVILAGAQTLSRTKDGGKNWKTVIDFYKPHEDQHRILFDRNQQDTVYAANDGGVFRSSDGGATWQTADADADVRQGRDLTVGLVTAQFYEAGISGDHAVGNLYHQGLVGASSLVAHEWGGIEGHSWEFANVHGDPKRAGVFYVFTSSALLRRHFPDTSVGLQPIGTFVPKCIAVDTQPGSGVLLVGTGDGRIVRCTNADATPPTWVDTTGYSGGNAVAIAFCPSRPQQAYAISADGHVFVNADVDAGSAWTARTALPVSTATALAVSVEDDQVLYAVAANYVYRSADGGEHWVLAQGTGGQHIPPGASLVAIVAGPGALYVAASEGVFMSPDGGQHWFDFQDNLPNVEIKDLLWTEGDLFAITHGRGLWHHGTYSTVVIPPVGSKHGLRWFIELWLAIHGGDPAPDAIRGIVGKGIEKAIRLQR